MDNMLGEMEEIKLKIKNEKKNSPVAKTPALQATTMEQTES